MLEVLRTERLRLRRFEPSDVDNLLSLYRDPEVMRYLSSEPWDRDRVRTEALGQILAEYERYRRFGYWAVETHDGGFVGRVGLHPAVMDPSPNGLWEHAPTDEADTASIGYRLVRRQWGQGYATEAGRALLSLAFGPGQAGRVVATTMAVNAASRRVLERLGFTHTRTVHLEWDDPLPGTEHGEVVYELNAPAHPDPY